MLSGKFAVVKSRSNSNPTFPVVPRVPRVALTLNPRLRALGLSPSAFNLSGWIPSPPPRCNKKQSFHKHSTDKHNIVKICALIGRNLF